MATIIEAVIKSEMIHNIGINAVSLLIIYMFLKGIIKTAKDDHATIAELKKSNDERLLVCKTGECITKQDVKTELKQYMEKEEIFSNFVTNKIHEEIERTNHALIHAMGESLRSMNEEIKGMRKDMREQKNNITEFIKLMVDRK